MTEVGSEHDGRIEVREDRIIGPEGDGELVLRRKEVVAVRLGSAPRSELPWLEGILGVVLVIASAFILAVQLDARGAGRSGYALGTMTSSASIALLARSLLRRPALLVDLRTGDRRRIWVEGDASDQARLLAMLRAQRWPVVS